jgi:PAS domain S-box-containing protein
MDYNKMTKAELIEALKSLQSPKASEHPAGELQRTMHELQVHQIELGMQNREGGETQQAPEESRKRYADLNEKLIKEIAERRGVEQALRESEERFRSLIQTAGSVIFCLSPDRRILEWNLEAERVYGWKREEVLGKDYYELFLPAEIRKTVAAKMQKVVAGELTRNFENPILTRDGRTRLLTWNAVCLRNEQNQPNGIICSGQDITETNNLKQAAQRKERLAALGQFAATLAHELRNLVGSIILNFDNLAEQLKNSERFKRPFNNIEQGIARIQNLISGVLDFARPAPPALEKANLHKVLDRSLQAVKQELEHAGIAIQKNYTAIPPYVWLDTNQMMQVFVNLFLNAKDAMYAGGNLTINTTCCENGIEVHIADSGKGISAENLEKIFDPSLPRGRKELAWGWPWWREFWNNIRRTYWSKAKWGLARSLSLNFH